MSGGAAAETCVANDVNEIEASAIVARSKAHTSFVFKSFFYLIPSVFYYTHNKQGGNTCMLRWKPNYRNFHEIMGIGCSSNIQDYLLGKPNHPEPASIEKTQRGTMDNV
jgi:hypothetical protein